MSSKVEKEGEGFQEVSRDNGGNGRNYQERVVEMSGTTLASNKTIGAPGSSQEIHFVSDSPGSDPVSRFTSTVPIHPI